MWFVESSCREHKDLGKPWHRVFVYRGSKVQGPFDELVLQQALANGTMSPDESCCREGEENWMSAATLFAPKPPNINASVSLPPVPLSRKERLIPTEQINKSTATAIPSTPKRRWWAKISGTVLVAFSLLLFFADKGEQQQEHEANLRYEAQNPSSVVFERPTIDTYNLDHRGVTSYQFCLLVGTAIGVTLIRWKYPWSNRPLF